MIDIHPLGFDGVLKIVPRKYGDVRGFFSETWSRRALRETYHCAGAGEATWCELARYVLKARGDSPSVEVVAIDSHDWPTRAVRPANSRLDCSKFARDFGWRAPDWHASVNAVTARLVSMQDGAAT